jgi:ferredoxin
VDKEGQLTILDPSPPDTLRAKVDAAIQYCPTRALSLEVD